MLYECGHCRKKAESLKRCAACSKIWYCNSECQKSNWPIHLIECNLGRPVTSADRLVASVYKQFPPYDNETQLDYGFTQMFKIEEVWMRLQVYSILVMRLQIKAKTIYEWMEEGKLATNMREMFDAILSAQERQQEPFLWFCRHQSTFSRESSLNSHNPARTNFVDDLRRTAWEYMGHDPSDSRENIIDSVKSLHPDHQACYSLVAIALSRMCPAPGQGLGSSPRVWVYFGFCGCITQQESAMLLYTYTALVRRVDYDTFYRAYASSSMAQLFGENGFPIRNHFVLDVLASRNYKSVWFLKDFVCADDETLRQATSSEDPSMLVDYGFVNCQTGEEALALRNVYKQVLVRSDADPLALHEACHRGKLFEYVGQRARVKPPQLFKRLMKNPYPAVNS